MAGLDYTALADTRGVPDGEPRSSPRPVEDLSYEKLDEAVVRYWQARFGRFAREGRVVLIAAERVVEP